MKKQQFCRWQKWCIIMMVLCLTFSLSACASTEGESTKSDSGHENMAVLQANGGAAEGNESYLSESEESEEQDEDVMKVAKDADTADESTAGAGKEKNQSAEQKTVTKEMLVYRGWIEIDTLNFDKSVADFKKLLGQTGGFVEKENYTDEGERYDDYYAVEEDEKHNSYTATIRVPSSQYDTVMEGAGNLGDIRTKTSNVQNVTQQYGTYQSQIKIYEAEYQRYLKLLEKASEDQYALEIEQKLFDLQVKIAEIKSNITNLETDVAYSYIDVTLTEVMKYQDRPKRKDTFPERLIRTCKNSWNIFLFIVEKLLFCLIYTWYYIAAILLLLFVIFKDRKEKDAGLEVEEDLEEEEPDSDDEEPDSDEEEPEDEQ